MSSNSKVLIIFWQFAPMQNIYIYIYIYIYKVCWHGDVFTHCTSKPVLGLSVISERLISTKAALNYLLESLKAA